MSKKKILFYKDSLDYGGDTKFLLNVINFYKNYDIEIVLGCKSKYDKLLLRKLTSLKIYYIQNFIKLTDKKNLESKIKNKLIYLLLPLKFLFLGSEFKKIFEKSNPDISFSFNGGFPGSYNALLFNFISGYLNIKKNFTFIASVPSKKSIITFYDFFVEKFLIKKISLFITNSNFQKKLLTKFRNIDSKKIRVILNPIKINQVKKNKNKNKLNICTISRLDQSKNIETIIKSIKFIKKKTKKFKLDILGSGNYREKLRELTIKENIDKYVNFRGFLNSKQLEGYLKNKAKIFIFASTQEGLPYSILESMNFNVPVIAIKFGGISSIFKNGKHILYINKNDSFLIAKKILELNNNIKLQNNLKKNASYELAKNFDRNKIHKQFLKIIK